jgi:DNA-directed RNA polymerase beta subunit
VTRISPPPHPAHLPTPQADRRCCEDNPDALTHHEVLLPGHLMLKFLREQLETALDAFRQQVGGHWAG